MGNPNEVTCGRIVHFFPNNTDRTILDEKVPAIVLNDSETPTIFVFHESGCGIRKEVPHKTTAGENSAYWDWPQVKSVIYNINISELNGAAIKDVVRDVASDNDAQLNVNVP